MSRILIVEDNEINNRLLDRRLSRLGHETLTAFDGVEALEVAFSHKPDVVLMDISMPQMNGLEATRKLREDERTQTTPVIAITAHVMPYDRERALAAGCDEYEPKPLDFRRLVDKITHFLELTGVPVPSKPPRRPAPA